MEGRGAGERLRRSDKGYPNMEQCKQPVMYQHNGIKVSFSYGKQQNVKSYLSPCR